MHDRKSEPASAGLGGKERMEQLGTGSVRDSRTRINHTHGDCAALESSGAPIELLWKQCRSLDAHDSIIGRCLQGVQHQIEECAVQHVLVATYVHRGAREIALDPRALGTRRMR